jgi:hypothetical protein
MSEKGPYDNPTGSRDGYNRLRYLMPLLGGLRRYLCDFSFAAPVLCMVRGQEGAQAQAGRRRRRRRLRSMKSGPYSLIIRRIPLCAPEKGRVPQHSTAHCRSLVSHRLSSMIRNKLFGFRANLFHIWFGTDQKSWSRGAGSAQLCYSSRDP